METLEITPVILCGGSGTRLWPLSTPERPKQFLKLDGQASMLAQTAARMCDDDKAGLRFAQTLVVGSVRHRDMIRDEVPGARRILEPFGRNSAAAVAAAALAAPEDALLLVLPADHSILRPDLFRKAVGAGAAAARDGHIVTFGITPSFPATGYGYIDIEPGETCVRKARKFVEKPLLDKAQAYLDSGHYLWNAGIFLFRAGTMLDAFRTHAPEILDNVTRALPQAIATQEESEIDAGVFDACPNTSIDYAIMEKFPSVMAVPVEMGWSDVGDYKALWELSEKDADGNVLMGPVTATGCRNCYIRSEAGPLSVSGLTDKIVIATGDHYMACDMAEAQSVKTLASAASK
ncbi:mannose-1-phosphate guanylyltransferase [Henriciella aquimarina]|uniref:mannose-1-phosphate guanylyltransferase n=1 Tax=Henriciella aquimarina TaxID=545261 RepID=UPI001301F2B2|nr:sugar phosphate nucleotidyltransferase [Henriciella aquimarina]